LVVKGKRITVGNISWSCAQYFFLPRCSPSRLSTIVKDTSGEISWWTFAGTSANATLANECAQILKHRAIYDSYSVTFQSHLSSTIIEQALHELRARDVKQMYPAIEPQGVVGLKFSKCLPDDIAVQVLQSRLSDPDAVAQILLGSKHFVIDH
jgi:ATP-dependent Lhr-like helicase